ncbi:hypothetical protein [Nitrosomonas sp.]|uniref:hypothetical protein n=1 Tax=Nitrosomonas sp. TaxID=42353 RepID=UPI00283D6B24|nr:hypothetical protein [Nitrosomonas sp.]MDR4514606.1 hypothetical protein [Nitrosomonas sp.]
MLELRTWIALFVLYGCSGVVIAENGIELADVLGTTAPSYENGVLIIPRVDTPEQVGRYQDAIFQFDPQSNTWALQHVTSTQYNAPRIWSVDVRVIDDAFPIQVFLQVTGDHGCGGLGQINVRRSDNLFEVQISEIQLGSEIGCTADIKEFVRIIPLNVYRLNAGIYQYSVNGGNPGTFSLVKDNVFDDECGGTIDPADSRCGLIVSGP